MAGTISCHISYVENDVKRSIHPQDGITIGKMAKLLASKKESVSVLVGMDLVHITTMTFAEPIEG